MTKHVTMAFPENNNCIVVHQWEEDFVDGTPAMFWFTEVHLQIIFQRSRPKSCYTNT